MREPIIRGISVSFDRFDSTLAIRDLTGLVIISIVLKGSVAQGL